MMLPFYPEDAAQPGSNGRIESNRPDPTACLRLTPPVRRDAPETSRAAARRIAGVSGAQRAAVLAYIVSRGTDGATDPEIAAGVGIPIQSVNPRRGELATLGHIALNGSHRFTQSGCRARVWVAREFAPKPSEPGKGAQ